ncbi:MAG: ATP-binding protein [Acidobacteria bacterium]|nr:ATP-binding protein [Acidobacteriota bacterium]
MPDIQILISQKESEWLDFKQTFHENNAKLLHDILCLSNSFYEGDRFIVFGIANDKHIHGVENDPNKKTNADLHDFLRQVHLNKIPQVELTLHKVEGHEIELLYIKNAPKKPYFLRKDFQVGRVLIRAGVIYTRLDDTNIPVKETAPEDHIELMWKERFGLLKPRVVSLEENFPVKLGDARERVFEILGEPDVTGWQVVQYYSEGIEISYDQHFDTVDGLIVYPLPAGTAFEGTVFGIKLGDSFARVKEIVGRPSHWGLAYENSSIAVWEIDDKLLVVEFWRSSNDKKTLLSSQQLGTVKSISYCNRKSFVGYNALVAITIEQIKRGITPPLFETENIVLMNVELDSPIFDEDYEMLGARAALAGGAEVLVAFIESKVVLAFWVYPLQWQYPVIRAIYKLGGEPDTTNVESSIKIEN